MYKFIKYLKMLVTHDQHSFKGPPIADFFQTQLDLDSVCM